jgi:hypothetical protein
VPRSRSHCPKPSWRYHHPSLAMPCRAKVPRRKLMSPLGVWYRVGPKDLRWSDSAVYPSPQSHSGHGTARKPGSCWRRARLSLAVGDLKSGLGFGRRAVRRDSPSVRARCSCC